MKNAALLIAFTESAGQISKAILIKVHPSSSNFQYREQKSADH